MFTDEDQIESCKPTHGPQRRIQNASCCYSRPSPSRHARLAGRYRVAVDELHGTIRVVTDFDQHESVLDKCDCRCLAVDPQRRSAVAVFARP